MGDNVNVDNILFIRVTIDKTIGEIYRPNPFFTTKDKGSGLGLSISHQIIQDHRGYIDVESELNKGTSFFVNLPLHQEYPQRRRKDLGNHRDIFNSFGRR